MEERVIHTSSSLERPSKRRKINETEDVDPDLEEDWERDLELGGCEEDFEQEYNYDCNPLRPPQFWDNLRPRIPLVTAGRLL